MLKIKNQGKTPKYGLHGSHYFTFNDAIYTKNNSETSFRLFRQMNLSAFSQNKIFFMLFFAYNLDDVYPKNKNKAIWKCPNEY